MADTVVPAREDHRSGLRSNLIRPPISLRKTARVQACELSNLACAREGFPRADIPMQLNDTINAKPPG